MTFSATSGAQNLLNREKPLDFGRGAFLMSIFKMAPKRHPKEKQEPEKALVYYVLGGGAYET